MGTRNLTIVINKKNEVKVAQYGQWDGYPRGQGVTALQFIRNVDKLAQLERAIENCRFYNRVKDIDNWMELYNSRCPRYDETSRRMLPDSRFDEDKAWFNLFITRDLGAGILDNICEALKVKEEMFHNLNIPKEHNGYFYLFDDLDFGKDSLMCEWAYCINFYTNKFIVYEGFNEQKELEDELFTTVQEEVDEEFKEFDNKYYGCKKVIEFDLDSLPTEENFLKQIEEITGNEED